jgi:chromosomal replication initiation ATPase DnaA
MAQLNHTSRLVETEEALTVLFCLIDDAYAHLNPRARCYESIKRLSDSEVIALAVPNSFAKEYIESRFGERIESLLRERATQ